MRARSLHALGRAFNEPRRDLAYSRGFIVRARHSGCISLVTFFVQAKKVTRSL